MHLFAPSGEKALSFFTMHLFLFLKPVPPHVIPLTLRNSELHSSRPPIFDLFPLLPRHFFARPLFHSFTSSVLPSL
jgi:hypothetical protein